MSAFETRQKGLNLPSRISLVKVWIASFPIVLCSRQTGVRKIGLVLAKNANWCHQHEEYTKSHHGLRGEDERRPVKERKK